MRRLAALTILALSSFLVSAAPVDATPTAPEANTASDRPADYVAYYTVVEQCIWNGVIRGYGGWHIRADFFHYGTAHITRCWYTPTQTWGVGVYSYCWQYVWGPGVARPYWDLYKHGFYPVRCW